jgi:predicted deacylase
MKVARRAVLALLPAALLGLVQPASSAPGNAAWGAIEVLGRSVAPGETARMPFLLGTSFVGSFLDTLVVVVRGAKPGPTLCITGGIHGDEINGVEIAHRIYSGIAGDQVAGTLLVIPAVNAHGFRTGSRYLADRRDLNRAFPGSATGSHADMIAHALFTQVRQHCASLLDLHTGSNSRTNLPQIRTDLGNARALDLARSFGVGVVLDGEGPDGNLRRAALDAGIPAVLYEAGEPLRFDENDIRTGVQGVRNVMAHLGMLPPGATPVPDSRVIRRTTWVRARGAGGIFLSGRKPGEQVRAGETLGTVTDPITETTEVIRAPRDGLLIGMALPQVVLPGYALFHLGN